jgi:hypothetical protein
VDRDLVHFAAHLWVLGFGYESQADTLVRHELESMRDLGIRLEPSHYVEMARCKPDDIGWDWNDYTLEAPRHREQAIALYEKLLLKDPAMPALGLVRHRLPRLRLNVDTNYHRYWCVSD